MYGLLLEAIVDYIVDNYGEDKWEQIRKAANLQHTTFATHGIYSESIISTIAKATAELTGEDVRDLMDSFGVSFVSFVGQYGYDKVLKVLGRNMRDFLSGLDNLHEYLRFSYPKLKPPSFFVENETQSGLTLHYRSRRKGFTNYVQGQIRQVGRLFYNTKIAIHVTSETSLGDLTHVVMRLTFDNTAYIKMFRNIDHITESLPLRSDVFFELFPFHIVFNRQLQIKSIGVSLTAIMPYIKGKMLKEIFQLVRPLVDLTWDSIMAHTNNVFEISSESCVMQQNETKNLKNKDPEEEYTLHLKGQMVFMPEWDCIIFMGTPVMENLEAMGRAGLYINDLSMHDSSRDLVLAGTQQSAELKLALDQEQQKSKILEESMQKLDEEMKRTDSLLYQMIPKPVADRLRSGEESISTCEVFDCLTIVFSDVVGFTAICSQISPMDVVSMLNAMYTKFDNLSELHKVYKVETIGDAYMGVAGAPDVTKFHAASICNMALDMLVTMTDLINPTSGESMKIRVGIHSGMAVAGVVGVKMPRYCLFGDTVNTASRMETNSEANKIHISETTRTEIDSMPYKVEERGTVEVKGKGHMKTYWLLGTTGEVIIPYSETPPPDMGRPGSLKSPSHLHRAMYSPVSIDDSSRSGISTPHSRSPTPVRRSKKLQNDKNMNNNNATTVQHLEVKEIEKEPKKVDNTKQMPDNKSIPPSKESRSGVKETPNPKKATLSKENSKKESKVNVKEKQKSVPKGIAPDTEVKNGLKDTTKKDEKAAPKVEKPAQNAQQVVKNTTDEKIEKTKSVPNASVNISGPASSAPNFPPTRPSKTPPSTPRKTVDLVAMEKQLKADAESLANNGYVSLETSLHKVAQFENTPAAPVAPPTTRETTLSNNAPKYIEPEPVTAAIEQPKTRPLEQSQTCVLL